MTLDQSPALPTRIFAVRRMEDERGRVVEWRTPHSGAPGLPESVSEFVGLAAVMMRRPDGREMGRLDLKFSLDARTLSEAFQVFDAAMVAARDSAIREHQRRATGILVPTATAARRRH